MIYTTEINDCLKIYVGRHWIFAQELNKKITMFSNESIEFIESYIDDIDEGIHIMNFLKGSQEDNIRFLNKIQSKYLNVKNYENGYLDNVIKTYLLCIAENLENDKEIGDKLSKIIDAIAVLRWCMIENNKNDLDGKCNDDNTKM